MTLRILVCIPTYNNPATILSATQDALAETSFDILVVDDGSTPAVSVPVDPRVSVLRHPENRGKGAAIQSAFQWAVARGFTHLLTVDGDGQHLFSEAGKLVEAAVKNPWNVIIGKRRLESQSVPGISRFGRAFSNFWVGYQTGHLVEDSQSGFRIYPLFFVQNMRFWTKRFDFEIEVLIRLLWSGVQIEEVEVGVFYPPPEERISHFRKFRDNVRISILNTLLVVLSLLTQNRQPKRTAAALGTGILVGSSPFFGFHTLIIAALAFFGRMNAAVMFLGSQISFPPLAVLLIPLEISAGRFTLESLGRRPAPWSLPNETLSGMIQFGSSHLAEWFAGWLIVGLGLGLLSGFATWRFLEWRAKKKAPVWTGRTRGGRFGNGFMKIVIGLFGLRTAYFCLLFIVPYFYLFAPTARRSLSEYWRAQRPQAGFWRRQTLILWQFFRFGQTLIDRFYQSQAPEPVFRTKPHGFESILQPIRERRPLILLSAHIGSWDIAAASLKIHGFEGNFNMVHYQDEGLTFEKLVGRAAAAEHVTSMLSNQSPVLAVRQRLEAGEPVGFMADRPAANGFELVPFLGKLAPFDTRPFRIAAACGSGLLFTFGFKESLLQYNFFAKPARQYKFEPGRPRPAQLRDWVASYAKAIEEMLERYPEQWFNFFPFFSSRPSSPGAGADSSREQNNLEEPWRKQSSPISVPAPGQRPSGAPELQP